MNRIKLLRYERGLSVSAVADAVGCTPAAIYLIENGATKQPTAATAKAIAELFEISVAELLGIDQADTTSEAAA